MSAPHGQGPPRSTVADALRGIVLRYLAVGDPTQFLVGERYLKSHGAPGRIILVREGGQYGGPDRMAPTAWIAAKAQGFRAFLWAAESIDDLKRYDALEDMEDRFVNAVRATMPGRVRISSLNPSVETNVVTFGEELQILVTWERNVPRDAAIWAVPVTAQPTIDVMRPNGDTGKTFTLDPTTNGSR